MERNDKDHEALKPHSSVGTHRDKEDSHPIPAKSANPKQLRHDHVASEHRPRESPIGTKITIQECEAFEWIRSVESNEKLHTVCISHDRTGQQDQLAHDVNMIPGENIVELV